MANEAIGNGDYRVLLCCSNCTSQATAPTTWFLLVSLGKNNILVPILSLQYSSSDGARKATARFRSTAIALICDKVPLSSLSLHLTLIQPRTTVLHLSYMYSKSIIWFSLKPSSVQKQWLSSMNMCAKISKHHLKCIVNRRIPAAPKLHGPWRETRAIRLRWSPQTIDLFLANLNTWSAPSTFALR